MCQHREQEPLRQCQTLRILNRQERQGLKFKDIFLTAVGISVVEADYSEVP
jgi:hypothetical protein